MGLELFDDEKKIKSARETGDSEAELNKGPKNPDIGRKLESHYFYSRSIILKKHNTS